MQIAATAGGVGEGERGRRVAGLPRVDEQADRPGISGFVGDHDQRALRGGQPASRLAIPRRAGYGHRRAAGRDPADHRVRSAIKDAVVDRQAGVVAAQLAGQTTGAVALGRGLRGYQFTRFDQAEMVVTVLGPVGGPVSRRDLVFGTIQHNRETAQLVVAHRRLPRIVDESISPAPGVGSPWPCCAVDVPAGAAYWDDRLSATACSSAGRPAPCPRSDSPDSTAARSRRS